MEISVYNQKGEEIGKAELPAGIFGLEINNDLIHQVVLAQQSNKRKNIAKAKDRGEVRGGGRKPWRQKGTGRARVGSNRSPIWKGGGVTFGPTGQEVFKKKISKKMRRKALLMVLSAKAKSNLLLVLDKLEIKERKTKLIAKTIKELESKVAIFNGGSSLIALPKIEKNIILSARNIKKISTIQAKDLNVLDLLSFKYLILPKESLEIIKNLFLEKNKISKKDNNNRSREIK